MKLRSIITSAAIVMLFLSAFAQEPKQEPNKKVTISMKKKDTAAVQSSGRNPMQSPVNGNRTIINIRSKFVRPIQLGDSTVHVYVGNVVAYHNGAVMLCDSAVRYNENRMECFDNVLINKDSTYVYGDRVIYNRITSTAQVFSPLVKMIDGKAVLYTYNFRYNTMTNIGEFYGGGTMSQGKTMLLESDRGYYFGETRDAVCVGNVELRDSTYLIKSDSLGFNMNSEIATFYKETYIWNDKKEILSANNGWYDTRSDHYHFTSNAYVLSADQEVWADDIDYRSNSDDAILKRDIQIFDKEQSVLAFGDYGRYWGLKGDAMLTENPSVINFQQEDEKSDSVFMRADSIFMYVIDSTSIYSADYIGNKKDEQVVDTGEELISGPVNKSQESDDKSQPADTTKLDAATNDDNSVGGDGVEEVVEEIEVSGESGTPSQSITGDTVALTRKELREVRRREKLAEKEAKRKSKDSAKSAGEIEDAVIAEAAAQEFISDIDNSVTDSLATGDIIADTTLVSEEVVVDQSTASGDVKAEGVDSSSDNAPAPEEDKERVIVGYHKVKIFRSDLQAICDSLVGFSRDSTIYLHRDPVMWNGENQIKSDLAVVYVKNETLDKAVFTGGEVNGNPIMSSEVDKDRYNQITGKTIEALFKDSEIYKTNVIGNAQTYYYMQDDATGDLQGFMVMDCADITFYIIDQEIDEIVFRTDPVYAIYPMNMIPGDQLQKFTNFVWEADKRPTKKDVFNRSIRSSQRSEYEKLPLPFFVITSEITAYKLSIIQDGLWKDRDDDITLNAIEFLDKLKSQGQN